MNRPRESLLTLFDPLFSGDPTTPPRDAPSPDLGSDKENSAPAGDDDPLTLTKFFNRIYTRPKTQLPRPFLLSKGRLIDLGDPNVSNEVGGSDSDSDSDDDVRSEHVFVVSSCEPRSTSIDNKDARDAHERRPLADIALGESRGNKASPSPAAGSAALGSPSPFNLARSTPTPAPSSSPLASVINAINGTASPSPPLTPSAPRIAVTPAEPTSPSPSPSRRQQLRPGAMLRATSPAESDSRRTSVDLQESLSVHFDESSFDLLKDKILFPESDSLGDDLDVDMTAPAVKVPENGSQRENTVTPGANAESEGEPDFGGMLEERLRDMKILDDESKDGNRDNISTPPAQYSICNISTPQAPLRHLVRPANKIQVPPPASITSNAPPALLPKRKARASISALPMPASATQRTIIAKKAKPETVQVPMPIPARKVAGGAPPPPPPRTMELGGVQRPPASLSVRVQTQRSKPTAVQASSSSSSKVAGGAGAGSRPSGLRPPTSRVVGASGITISRASAVAGAIGAGSSTRSSISMTGVGAGRPGSFGVNKTGAAKGDRVSAASRIMRRA